jgi:L-amino acid N-acyltransferase YncA
MLEVRIATIADAKGILEIYAPYVVNTAFTFETEVPSVLQMEKRIETGLQKFPWIVCTVDGLLAAYVYASSHREREAYQWTSECSVYVHDRFKGKGIGKELYEVLFRVLGIQGLRNVYAGITLPNPASVKLHEQCGFELFAVYENVGYKLNSWHKVGWWRLNLNSYEPEPASPLKFSQMDHDALNEILGQAARGIRTKLTS